MNNWSRLNDLEYREVWDLINDNFHFIPNASKRKNLVRLPKLNICFDISRFYNSGFSLKVYDDLHKLALIWFKEISKGKRMYALNWQHDCYTFSADLPFEKDEFDEWLISVFPNGDYLFFANSDFKNGIFADGINLTFSLWGEDIIKECECKMPEILIKSCPSW